jgi:hypothetical protein
VTRATVASSAAIVLALAALVPVPADPPAPPPRQDPGGVRPPDATRTKDPASEMGRPAAPGGEWGPLPTELVTVLEAKSAAYARRALKFSCRETVRQAQYRGGEAERESVREFEYLLVPSPDALEEFAALRTKPGSKDTNGEKVDVPFPEPYTWSLLFDPRIRSTLKFQVGRWHTTPWKLAIPIEWASSAPVLDKQRVTEWTGTAEIEFRTGNLVRVVARPSLQDERLSAELDRFMTSLKFMGMSTGNPPLGLELTVDFDDEHDGFTYPSRVELVTFQQVSPDTRETVSRKIVQYSNYRFFGAHVDERIPPLTWRPPAPK